MKDLGITKSVELATTEQSLPLATRELVAEIYDRFETWGQLLHPVYDEVDKCRKIIRMRDPDQDPPLPADATEDDVFNNRTLQMQTLRSTFKNCVADQLENFPEAIMQPETKELKKVAEDFTDVMAHVLEVNNYASTYREIVEDFIGVGTAVHQLFYDTTMRRGRGEVAVIRWPIEKLVWDPMAEKVQDCRAIMKVSWHPLSWYAEHYPEQAPWVAGDGADRREIGLQDALLTSDEDTERAALIEYWYRRYDAKAKRYTINVAQVAGGAYLDLKEDVYAHGMYPFVVSVFSRVEGRLAGEGLITEFVDMMRYINRWMKYVDANFREASKNRLLVNRESGIDPKDLADWNKNIIPGDKISEEFVRWMQAKPMNGLVVTQMMQMAQDIKQDSGQNQFARGETAGGVTAYSAIAALQEAGGKIARMYTGALNASFKDVAEQVMWLIAELYTDRDVQYITGRTGEYREVDMSANHLLGDKDLGGESGLPYPPYAVRVNVQRRNPMRVQAENEMLFRAFELASQSGQIFPVSALFEALTFEGKDRILPLLQKVDKITEAMQTLQAENEQLKAAIVEQQKLIAKQGSSLRAKPGRAQAAPAPQPPALTPQQNSESPQ